MIVRWGPSSGPFSLLDRMCYSESMGQFPIRWDNTILRLIPRYCEKCETRISRIVATLDMRGPLVRVLCGHCCHVLLAESPELLVKYGHYFHSHPAL